MGPRNREVRFFGILRESPPLHFYVLQAVVFEYFLYRFASRDYTVYGWLRAGMFDYPRTFGIELWPIPPTYLTTGQFLYAVLPRPTPSVIALMQWVVIVCCALGLIGLWPKWSALGALLVGLHITGMLQASNAEIDGGTLALAMMLVLALSPSRSFYGVRNGFSLRRRSVDYHWPVFLALFLMGSYYAYAGINKLVDIGPHWPLVLQVDDLAADALERSIFRASRLANPAVASWFLSPAWSPLGGFLTLVGELSFITVLFLPRYRLMLIASMIAMHLLVYLLAGINFLGNSVLLMLCLDWNVIARRAQVYYDEGCAFCVRAMALVKRLDWFGRLELVPIGAGRAEAAGLDPAALRDAMGLVEENGELYYGADAFEQACARCPALWGVPLVMKVPGMIYAARWMYRLIARNRVALGCGVASGCKQPSESWRPWTRVE